MRIQVLTPAGLHHHASGFHAWEPGVYDFPDEPAYAGWLAGQCERGVARLLPDLIPGAEPILPDGHAPLGELTPLVEGEPVEYVAGESLGPLLDAAGSPINDPADVREPVRCTGRTKQRKPCRKWALEGSDRCAEHPHECKDCQKALAAEEVVPAPDPFAHDVHGDAAPVRMCDGCRKKSVMEI